MKTGFIPSLDMMRRVLAIRQRLDRRCDTLMLTDDAEKFWRVFELYKRACRLELRLVERRAAAVKVRRFPATTSCVRPKTVR